LNDSSCNAIESLQKIWTKPLNSYGSLKELLKHQSGSCVAVNGGSEITQISLEISSFVFRRFWNGMRVSN